MFLTVGGPVRTCCDTLRERMTSPTRARAQASLAACVGKGRGVVGHDVQIAHASEVFVWCPKARFCGRRCSTHTTRPRQRTKPAASTTGRKRAKKKHRGPPAGETPTRRQSLSARKCRDLSGDYHHLPVKVTQPQQQGTHHQPQPATTTDNKTSSTTSFQLQPTSPATSAPCRPHGMPRPSLLR